MVIHKTARLSIHTEEYTILSNNIRKLAYFRGRELKIMHRAILIC